MRRLVVALATLALLVAFTPGMTVAGPATFGVSAITVTLDGPEDSGLCELTVRVTYAPAVNRVKGVRIQQLVGGVANSTPLAARTPSGTTSYEFHEVGLGNHSQWSWVAWVEGGGGKALSTAQYTNYFQWTGGGAYTCPAGAVIADYP